MERASELHRLRPHQPRAREVLPRVRNAGRRALRELRRRAAAAIETALREGERLIAETGAHSYEPLLHEERARLAAALGDAAGRERALGEARRLFTEMDATGHRERLDREWGRS